MQTFSLNDNLRIIKFYLRNQKGTLPLFRAIFSYLNRVVHFIEMTYLEELFFNHFLIQSKLKLYIKRLLIEKKKQNYTTMLNMLHFLRLKDLF